MTRQQKRKSERMKAKNKRQITIDAVGDATIEEQIAMADKQGADSLVTTCAKLYIKHLGMWIECDPPKLSAKKEAEVRKLCAGQSEKLIKTVLMQVALAQ